MSVLPLLEERQRQVLTRQMRHPDALRQLIDIEHANPLHSSDFVEIIIDREQPRTMLLS